MIHQDDEFTHDGSQGDLGGFACQPEALIKLLEGLVAAGGDEGGHVEGPADGRTAATNGSAAPPLATFAGMGCQAGQGRGLAPVEGAQFGQFGQHAQGGDGSHPFDGLKGLSALIQGGDLGTQDGELVFDLLDGLFQLADQTFGLALQDRQGQVFGLEALGHEDLQELDSPTDQFGQVLLLGLRGAVGLGRRA